VTIANNLGQHYATQRFWACDNVYAGGNGSVFTAMVSDTTGQKAQACGNETLHPYHYTQAFIACTSWV
jgi:hypothetical protein